MTPAAETAPTFRRAHVARPAAVAHDNALTDYLNDHPYPREAAADALEIEAAGVALADAIPALIKAFGGTADDYLWPICDQVEHGSFLKRCAEMRLEAVTA